MPQGLDFSDLHLRQAAFELRFSKNYLLWDRSGLIWREVARKFTALEVEHAEPGKIIFRLDKLQQTSLEPERWWITAHEPTASLESFFEVAASLSEIVVRNLELAEYSRLGLRVIYSKEFDDIAAASSALMSTGVLAIPDGRQFSVSGSALRPAYSFRREDGKNGFLIQVKADSTKVDVKAPAEVAAIVEPFSREIFSLTFDVDFYVMASVSVGQLSLLDWLKQAFHLIKRDSESLFPRG